MLLRRAFLTLMLLLTATVTAPPLANAASENDVWNATNIWCSTAAPCTSQHVPDHRCPGLSEDCVPQRCAAAGALKKSYASLMKAGRDALIQAVLTNDRVGQALANAMIDEGAAGQLQSTNNLAVYCGGDNYRIYGSPTVDSGYGWRISYPADNRFTKEIARPLLDTAMRVNTDSPGYNPFEGAAYTTPPVQGYTLTLTPSVAGVDLLFQATGE